MICMIKKYKMFFTMVIHALLRRHTRMLVALLAVAVGATIISGMITVYEEVPQQMGREFRAYGANLLILPNGDKGTFNEGELSTVNQLLSGNEVVGVTPFLYDTIEVNKQPVTTSGTDFEAAKKVNTYWQVRGQWPQKGEREILLGAELAKKISRDPDKLIGQNVTVSAGEGKAMRNFKVAGIVATGSKEEQFAFIDLKEMQDLSEKSNQVSLAQVSIVADGDKLNGIVADLDKGDANIQAQPVQQITRSEGNVLGKLQVLVLLVTIVVLMLTMICVTTTMMAVVTERRKEIGLKKALGASNKNIVIEFFGEGCVLGGIGGVLGSGFGYVFAQGVSMNVFNRAIDFSPSVALISIILSILVTGAASLVPVRIATSVDPAIVLRGE